MGNLCHAILIVKVVLMAVLVHVLCALVCGVMMLKWLSVGIVSVGRVQLILAMANVIVLCIRM